MCHVKYGVTRVIPANPNTYCFYDLFNCHRENKIIISFTGVFPTAVGVIIYNHSRLKHNTDITTPKKIAAFDYSSMKGGIFVYKTPNL